MSPQTMQVAMHPQAMQVAMPPQGMPQAMQVAMPPQGMPQAMPPQGMPQAMPLHPYSRTEMFINPMHANFGMPVRTVADMNAHLSLL